MSGTALLGINSIMTNVFDAERNVLIVKRWFALNVSKDKSNLIAIVKINKLIKV